MLVTVLGDSVSSYKKSKMTQDQEDESWIFD